MPNARLAVVVTRSEPRRGQRAGAPTSHQAETAARHERSKSAARGWKPGSERRLERLHLKTAPRGYQFG